MIEKLSVQDVGFVTFSLSRKWLTKVLLFFSFPTLLKHTLQFTLSFFLFVSLQSIHNMLKDGIDTLAPKLPVQRVIVEYPSLAEETHVGRFRRHAIRMMLIRMLWYSKVDSWSEHYSHTYSQDILSKKASEARGILKKWFSINDRRGGDVVIDVEDKPPFILAKRDFDNSYKDLGTLRYFTC